MIVAPAMNHAMWEHPATRANLATLADRGVAVVAPGVGALATKHEWGVGRLAEPADLLAAVEAVVPTGARPWDGLHVLVTAGGTREPIDSVRFVGNRSSGRMGFALADEAAALGADVTVVAANVALPRTPRVRYVDVGTAAELHAAADAAFDTADVLLMAAAVADFRPPAAAPEKLKKAGRDALRLDLEPTVDVLAALGARRRPDQTLVGFAAEHGSDALDAARQKRERKHLDAVVLNDISRKDIGFDGVHNEVTIVTEDGERRVPRAAKGEVARAILAAVTELRAGAAGEARR